MHRVSRAATNAPPSEPNTLGFLAVFILLCALAFGNSGLFFYAATHDGLLSERLLPLFLAVSGVGHLTYLLLPWYFREFVAPALGFGNVEHNLQGGNDPDSVRLTPPLLGLTESFGALMCVLALGLWLVHSGVDIEALFGRPEPEPAVVTEANCALIGGTAEVRDGRLVCRLN